MTSCEQIQKNKIFISIGDKLVNALTDLLSNAGLEVHLADLGPLCNNRLRVLSAYCQARLVVAGDKHGLLLRKG